jgi:DNA-binding MarR family transcriptional regulator
MSTLDEWATFLQDRQPEYAAVLRRVRNRLAEYMAAETQPRPLTRKQAAIYAYLAAFISDNGYAPSFEEIAEQFGFTSLATVYEHLSNLAKRGWIRRSYNRSRAIELLVPPRTQPSSAEAA